MWTNSLLCAFFVSATAAVEPEVEIADLFGNVLFQQGIPQSISCTVLDPLPYGVFTWKVGDRVIENSNKPENVEEDEIIQVLQFTPTLEDSERDLTCQYGERGEQAYSDHITMGIYVMDIPSDPISPGMVKEGDPITLQVTAGLYPPPEPEDILWEVKEPSGKVVVEMSPGGQDMYGMYMAREIKVVSSNLYMMSLDISVLDQKEVSNTHTVTITTKGIKKTVNFNLAVKMKQKGEVEGDDEGEDLNTPDTDGKQTSKEEEPETGALGMGTSLFIIIGIIAVFVIVCIVFCIIRRRRKTRSKDRQTYTAVKTDTIFTGSAMVPTSVTATKGKEHPV